jgi:PAS domain S-box-containing protein
VPLYRHLVSLGQTSIVTLLIVLFLIKPVFGLTKGNNLSRVLVLHSYHHGLAWSDSISEGIRTAFSMHKNTVELCFEFMDTRRIYTDEYFKEMAQFYQTKYTGRQLDVIIACDDHALNFMLGLGKEVLPEIPVVFCSASGFEPSMRKEMELTGLQESIDIKATLDIALILHPQTKRVIVITDITRTGKALEEKARKNFEPYRSNLQFVYLNDLTRAQLKSRVAQLEEGDLVFLFLFTRDKDGRVFPHEQFLIRLAPYCQVPIYSVWEFYLGSGIVGGKLTNGFEEGLLVGRMATRILNGEKASRIPIGSSPTQFMFDYSQLERFGVALEDLPPDAKLINRPFSFYQAYKALIWNITVIFVLLVGLIIFLIFNIRRRRRIEEALQKERDRSQLYLDVAGVILVVINRNQRVELINQKGCEVLGYQVEEIIGRNWFDSFLLKEEKDQVKKIFNSLMEGKQEPAQYFENTILARGGKKRTVAWYNTVLKDKTGKTVGTLSSGEDITDRQKAEEALKKSEEQLRQVQKLQGLGQLAGGIAHDFNNILTAIIGNTEIALRGLEKGKYVREDLEQVILSGKKASELVNKILAFSRRQVIYPEVVDMNNIILNFSKTLKRVISEDIKIEMNLHENISLVTADPTQIEQILINLAVNAQDAIMQKRGARRKKLIKIETAEVVLDKDFIATHIGSTIGPHIILSVTDRGVGMEKKIINRIFEPFFTTKEIGKGTGLGLSTVYGIVKQNNGSIYIYSEPDEGTCVKIYWPALMEKTKPKEPIKEKLTEGGEETILLVEDDERVRKTSEQLLVLYGYRVLSAANGKMALKLIKKKNTEIDILVTDVVMPEMGGIELAEKLNRIFPELKVLYCSGYPDTHIVSAKGKLNEDVNFLTKPYTSQKLAKIVRKILDKKS